MTDDQRMTWGFIIDVLDVLERHGYHRSDNRHTGMAFELISHLGRTYEGTLDGPGGAYVVVPPTLTTAPEPARADATTVSADEVKTLLTALDEAAEHKRDRAQTCADCADQSCGTCQWRLQAAQTYDQLTARLLEAAAVPRDAGDRPPEPEHTSGIIAQPPAADKEAGQ